MLWCHLHQSISFKSEIFLLTDFMGCRRHQTKLLLCLPSCSAPLSILSYPLISLSVLKVLLLSKSFEHQKPLPTVDLKDVCKTFVVLFSQRKQLLWVVSGFRLCHVGKRKRKTLNLAFTVIWLFPGYFCAHLHTNDSLGFSIMPKDTLTCRLETTNLLVDDQLYQIIYSNLSILHNLDFNSQRFLRI